ncbi:GL14120 [Drosophila persimilis]|uniref:GL14120 n=1 Tax=Drosophila persimilis TaxID=7234 RepID=B4IS12_DROPE|nr:GL14120 [Drosophila persimilis]
MGCSAKHTPPIPPPPSANANTTLAPLQPIPSPSPSTPLKRMAARLFCIKLRRSRLRRCSCGGVALQQGDGNVNGSTAGSATCGSGTGDNLCHQVLLNPLQAKNEADYEKLSTGKKDSIVTVAALGNFTHSVVRRATGNFIIANMLVDKPPD